MKRFAKVIVSAALVCGLLPVVPSAFAVDAEPSASDNGVVVNKTAVDNGDGSYTISLEAYATGESVTNIVNTDVPTDIILVLDQSGSMKENMSQVTYEEYVNRSNNFLYEKRHNGGSNNLWYKLEDGSYASVSVAVTGETAAYNALPKDISCSDLYADYRDNLYYLNLETGNYEKVTLTRRGGSLIRASYSFSVESENLFSNKPGSYAPGQDGYQFYSLSADFTNATYSYSYNIDGTEALIVEAISAATVPDAVFYEKTSTNSVSRKIALQNSLENFLNSVTLKAQGADGMFGTADDVDHRVAIVGFASESGYGNNTELLSIAGNNSGSLGVRYGRITPQNYKDVLQDMSTFEGRDMARNAVNALATEGATRIDLGMEMAKSILDNNPVPDGDQRNRVVIVFTDGMPTDYSDFSMNVANNAISHASSIKNMGATVYSVGIFDGADATSAGNVNGSDNEKCNWFMQTLSSNNGSPRYPSYYLSAADAGTLNNIFQQISEQINSGGSHTSLDASAVITDVIAPAFVLPEGTEASDIRLETYRCVGKSDGEFQWEKNDTAMGATARITSTDASQAITSNNKLSVTGFNFCENYVGTDNGEYRGNKLVISFDVVPREGFFGGNGVYTNVEAYLWENAAANQPIMQFPKPQVDVPLATLEVNAPNFNAYYTGDNTGIADDALLDSLIYAKGYGSAETVLDLEAPNYGVEAWQNEYVNLSASANMGGLDLANLSEDASFTVAASLMAKEPGIYNNVEKVSNEGNIKVFFPQLTYQDSVAWYGDDVPEYEEACLLEETWVHVANNQVTKHDDADVNMYGTKPSLDLSYNADEGIEDGKIATKQDIVVAAHVKSGEKDITAKTSFAHQACDGKTCELPAGKNFFIHVNTCELTLAKLGGSPNEPYAFTVYKDGEEYTELTLLGDSIKTLVELPVGTYTIAENSDWSWRYSAKCSTGVSLDAQNPKGRLSCTNSKTDDTWLNGYSAVVTNVFDKITNKIA